MHCVLHGCTDNGSTPEASVASRVKPSRRGCVGVGQGDEGEGRFLKRPRTTIPMLGAQVPCVIVSHLTPPILLHKHKHRSRYTTEGRRAHVSAAFLFKSSCSCNAARLLTIASSVLHTHRDNTSTLHHMQYPHHAILTAQPLFRRPWTARTTTGEPLFCPPLLPPSLSTPCSTNPSLANSSLTLPPPPSLRLSDSSIEYMREIEIPKPIAGAVLTGREEFLTCLLERFCEVNGIDGPGCICRDGRPDAVKLILQYGADPRVPTGENAPLVVAQRRQHHQIITLVRAALVEPQRPRLLHKARFLLDAADAMRKTMPACLWPRQPWVEVGRAAMPATSTLSSNDHRTKMTKTTTRMATFKAAAVAAGAAAVAAAATATAGPGGRRNKEQEEAEEEKLLTVIQYMVGRDEHGRKGGMIDVLFFDLMGMLLPRWDSERKRT